MHVNKSDFEARAVYTAWGSEFSGYADARNFYKVERWTKTACTLQFYAANDLEGARSIFAAGIKNWPARGWHHCAGRGISAGSRGSRLNLLEHGWRGERSRPARCDTPIRFHVLRNQLVRVLPACDQRRLPVINSPWLLVLCSLNSGTLWGFASLCVTAGASRSGVAERGVAKNMYPSTGKPTTRPTMLPK